MILWIIWHIRLAQFNHQASSVAWAWVEIGGFIIQLVNFTAAWLADVHTLFKQAVSKP